MYHLSSSNDAIKISKYLTIWTYKSQKTLALPDCPATATESYKEHKGSKRNKDIDCIVEIRVLRVNLNHVQVGVNVLVHFEPNP